jgi:alkanesulfonate monooxygenase SsuD/methylene tetrahydromethanopterin reductase-like flavin-dependent oxidoreductase (luciferase family)
MTARLCDWAFMAVDSVANGAALATDFKQRAGRYKRTLGCAVYPYILWRETAAEAQAERDRIIAAMDRVAAENWARGLFAQSGSFDLPRSSRSKRSLSAQERCQYWAMPRTLSAKSSSSMTAESTLS